VLERRAMGMFHKQQLSYCIEYGNLEDALIRKQTSGQTQREFSATNLLRAKASDSFISWQS
jgi:hypothetical protein